MELSSTASHDLPSPHAPYALRVMDQESTIRAFGTVMHYRRRKIIFAKGDEASFFYGVISGVVRLSISSAGGIRTVVGFALPGDFFGIEWRGRHTLEAETIDDATLVCFGSERLRRLSDENKVVRSELFSILQHNLRAVQNHLTTLGSHCARARVATFLIELMDRNRNANRLSVNIPMSREDIGDYLGLTIETVCRTLTELRLGRIIEVPRSREIMIRNLRALRKLSCQNS